VNQQDELQLLSQTQNVIMLFSAEWCGPCKVLKEKLKDLIDIGSLQGVTLKVIDCDKHADFAKQHQIRSIPIMLFFRGGQVVQRVMGVYEPHYYRELAQTVYN
jgi:thioredoxin 1